MMNEMSEKITPDFIRNEIENQSYEISIHADDERNADELTITDVEFALLRCEIIEQYPTDPRGKSCLVIGLTQQRKSIHIVCGKNRSGHLILVTIYVPSMPKWKDTHTSNR